MSLAYVRIEDLRRAFPGGDFARWIAALYLDGRITKKLAERAHHEHCGRERTKAALAAGAGS